MDNSKRQQRPASRQRTKQTKKTEELERPAQEGAAASGAGKGAAASAANGPPELGAFRRDCEAWIGKELAKRMVVLTADGEHPQIQESIVATRLYQACSSLTARLVANYDPKNAHLADVFEHECLAQREPVVGKEKLERFCTVRDKIMQEGRYAFFGF